jgi:hypothetical protein
MNDICPIRYLTSGTLVRISSPALVEAHAGDALDDFIEASNEAPVGKRMTYAAVVRKTHGFEGGNGLSNATSSPPEGARKALRKSDFHGSSHHVRVGEADLASVGDRVEDAGGE